jgi:hypothetical protein
VVPGTGGDDGVGEEVVAVEAGVALAAVGVEDPEGRPPARRAGPIAGHDHLRPLADDVPAEPDPRAAGQLEPDPGRLADRAGEGRGQSRRLEDDEADARPPGEGRQPARQPLGHGPDVRGALREVEHQQVDRPAGQERTGDGDPLVEVARRHDDEPFGPDAAGDRLDRVERAREIQPGDDRPGPLGLGHEPERQRGPAARRLAPQRDAHAARQAARPEDRIKGGEAGGVDTSRIWLARSAVLRLVVRDCQRHGRERPLDRTEPIRESADGLAESRGSGRTPPRPEGRERRRHVGRECRHRPQYRTCVRMNQGPN